jgi:hypothetical protein
MLTQNSGDRSCSATQLCCLLLGTHLQPQVVARWSMKELVLSELPGTANASARVHTRRQQLSVMIYY